MSYRVYFGRLPESLSQDDFEKMLAEHGKAKSIEWKSGYAYVDYKHGSDASKTVQNLNGKEVDGNKILVEIARNGMGGYAVAGGLAARSLAKPPQPRPVRTPHRVRIENLSSRAKWMELKELLSLAGEVTFADTHKRKTGEGIVEFAKREDLEEAIRTFNNTTFFGKTIKLVDESPGSRSQLKNRPDTSSSPPRQRSSERKRRSRSRSASARRQSSPRRRLDRKRKSRSRSISPGRKSNRHYMSWSRSSSKGRSGSIKKHRAKTPPKSSRNSHKKPKKARYSSSHSRSRSPKHKKRSSHSRKHKRDRTSSTSSDGDNDVKKKSKSSGRKRHSSSNSATSTSGDDSSSDRKSK